MLVPISNWAAFGGSKEVIIWMPIDMIANTITAVIAVRKQIIEDIYQIMGLSDIMRGATDPGETLGAQQLKSQYGSVRIRDKQGEMVRVARDIEEITAEIMCSEFAFDTLIADVADGNPDQAEQQQKLMVMAQQLQAMQQQAHAADAAGAGGSAGAGAWRTQQNPEAMKQLEQQYMQLKGNIEDEQQKPTAEQVEQFIRDYRTTAFVLDIETDSTIQADENAEKQRRGEFMGMMAQLLPQLAAADRAGAGRGGVLRRAAEVLRCAVPRWPLARRLDRQPGRADRDEGGRAHRQGRSQAGGRAEEDGGAGPDRDEEARGAARPRRRQAAA